MQEFRCTKCNKLLFKASFPIKPREVILVPEDVGINRLRLNGKAIEIKCPRCNCLNNFSA